MNVSVKKIALALMAPAIMTILCLDSGSASAVDVKEVNCLDVAEMCNGANVFVTCSPTDGSADLSMLLTPGSGVDQSSVGNRNALILTYMNHRAQGGKTRLNLKLSYVFEPPFIGAPPMNVIQQVTVD